MDRTDPRWYHLIVTPHGGWLPGDPRGFRTRHHRARVDGDYRNPKKHAHFLAGGRPGAAAPGRSESPPPSPDTTDPS